MVLYLCSVSCTLGGPTHQIDVAPGHQSGENSRGLGGYFQGQSGGGTGKSIDTGGRSVVARGWKE